MANIRKKGKVLVVTYYWPPAGGPGVQRIVMFVKYLMQLGWEPIVLTVEDGEYPALDHNLVTELPEGLKVVKTKAIEPFGIYKKLLGKDKTHKIDTYVLNQEGGSLIQRISRWIRLNVFIPDGRIGWYPFAKRKGLAVIKNENIQLIYSCSPPHSVQLIAKVLARKSNLPWLADFRDPWSSIVAYQGQHRSFITRYIDKRLEKSVLKNANHIVVTSQGLKDKLVNSYRLKEDGVTVITNGFDKRKDEVIDSVKMSEELKIFYAGNLSVVRIPYILLDALEKINNKAKIKNVKFYIAGKACDDFWNIVKEKQIEHMIVFLGYISHQEVLSQYEKVDILLQVVDDVPDNHLFIAGKLFDYLGTRKPIIAIGPKEGEVRSILENTKSGFYYNYTESQRITSDIVSMLEEEVDLNTRFQFENIEQYSRINLTKKLVSRFESIM